MMKKLFLIVVTFFATIQAQDVNQDDANLAFQELIYDMGICLADQDTVVDVPTAKAALLHLYQDVSQVMQIVDLFMIIDEEVVEQKITTVEELIDYEIEIQQDAAQYGIAWLRAYQDLFIIFTALHNNDVSFEVWCDDMAFFGSLADDEEPSDPNYLELWYASCAVLEAQADFEDALKDFE